MLDDFYGAVRILLMLFLLSKLLFNFGNFFPISELPLLTLSISAFRIPNARPLNLPGSPSLSPYTEVTVSLSFSDTQTPKIVEDPVNKSAVIGYNVTLNCTATGRPKPTITWIKNNDSYAVQSNPRANVIPVSDDKIIHGQLLITGVKKEDDDKYQCVASNGAGEKTSRMAVLDIKDSG